MKIQFLIDNPHSWIVPYAIKTAKKISNKRHLVKVVFSHDEVKKGDILILLSCEKKFSKLHYNKYNLVVHESPLPKGKGWSPLTWQVLEGKKIIPVTLFEASDKIDSGPIYSQMSIKLNGTELINELRKKQATVTQKLILDFLNRYPNIYSIKQKGKASFYEKRTPIHSKLNINKTIKDQFNLLRVCDNKRYPAYFELNGKKFLLKIYKKKNLFKKN